MYCIYLGYQILKGNVKTDIIFLIILCDSLLIITKIKFVQNFYKFVVLSVAVVVVCERDLLGKCFGD